MYQETRGKTVQLEVSRERGTVVGMLNKELSIQNLEAMSIEVLYAVLKQAQFRWD